MQTLYKFFSTLLFCFIATFSFCQSASIEGTYIYKNETEWKDYITIQSIGGDNYLVERVVKRRAMGGLWDSDGSFKMPCKMKDGLIELGRGENIAVLNNGTKLLAGRYEYLKQGGAQTNTNSQNNQPQTQVVNNNVTASKAVRNFNYDNLNGFLINNSDTLIVKIKRFNITDERNFNYEIQEQFSNSLYAKRVKFGTIQNSTKKYDTLSIKGLGAVRYVEHEDRGQKYYDAIFDYEIQTYKNDVFQKTYRKQEILNSNVLKIYYSKDAIARDFIHKLDGSFQTILYVIYPIEGEIVEITDRNKKSTEAKKVKINVGSNVGLGKNYNLFIVPYGENKVALQVVEVYDEYSICKVLNYDKEINTDFGSKKLVVKTIYK